MISFAENRPYWFDIKKELTGIWDRVKSVKQAITDTVAWLKSTGDDVAKRFTGIDLVSIHCVHEGIVPLFLCFILFYMFTAEHFIQSDIFMFFLCLTLISALSNKMM